MVKQATSLRSQLKATSIKKLKQRVDADNNLIGAQGGNEYLNLQDGKTMKIRIFPAHPGQEDFYIPKKCYWIGVVGNDGDMRRTTVLDSKVHGGTKYDVIEEYVKFAKKKCSKDSDKLKALTGEKDSLNPQYTWLCYADEVNGDEALKAKLWEFKKTVRDGLNKLAFSEDEDDVIEVDPFTDVDEGMPVMVKYLKNPNKKKGENYYEVNFPKKAQARPLTDEEIEYFMSLKPLTEILQTYSMKDFEKALEGLQNFDEENEIGLFEDEEWLEMVEKIKEQYDGDSDSGEEEEEDEKPKKKVTKTIKKKVEDEDEDESEQEEEKSDESEDEFDDMNRNELKGYIVDNDLDVKVKKSMSDDDIREAIRKAVAEKEEDEDESESEEETETEEEEDEKPKSSMTLADIRKKLAKK